MRESMTLNLAFCGSAVLFLVFDYYFHLGRNLHRKRRTYPWFAALGFLWLALYFGHDIPDASWWMWLAPALAASFYLHLRLTRFCEQCTKPYSRALWIGRRDCPYCGTAKARF